MVLVERLGDGWDGTGTGSIWTTFFGHGSWKDHGKLDAWTTQFDLTRAEGAGLQVYKLEGTNDGSTGWRRREAMRYHIK